ncbi:MAG: hypothetical protein AAGB19_09300 [Cyanobacteria bacterium P01_F01_bin.3]
MAIYRKYPEEAVLSESDYVQEKAYCDCPAGKRRGSADEQADRQREHKQKLDRIAAIADEIMSNSDLDPTQRIMAGHLAVKCVMARFDLSLRSALRTK